MNIQVTARSSSNDPTQESLRERKSKWNDAVSELIVKMIVLKRGMNGRGDEEVGIPSGDIKDPLPNEVVVYLHSVSDDYLKVMTEGRNIVQQQSGYSGSRRKGKKEMPLAASDNSDLVARGGVMSRFHLWGLEGEHKAARLGMIRFLGQAEHKLHDIDNNLTNTDANSLAQAIIDIDKFAIAFKTEVLDKQLPLLVKATNIGDKLPTAPPPGTKKIQTGTAQYLRSVLEEASSIRIVNNYLRTVRDMPQGIRSHAEDIFGRLDAILRNYEASIMGGIDPAEFRTELLSDLYKQYLEIAIKFIGPARNYQELVAKIPQISDEQKEAMRREDEEFEKLAHNAVTRWMKRKWLLFNASPEETMKGAIIEQVLIADKKGDLLITMLNDKKSDPLRLFSETKELAGVILQMLIKTLPIIKIRMSEQDTIDPPEGEKLLRVKGVHKSSINESIKSFGAWIGGYGGLVG